MKDIQKEVDMVVREAEKKLEYLISSALREDIFGDIEYALAALRRIKDPTGGELIMESKSPQVAYEESPDNKYNDDDTYPKFSQAMGFLYREGWSKKEQKSYTQRLNMKYIPLVAEGLVNISSQKSPFEVKDLLPIIKEESGEDVKSYKTYFVLAWMRKVGLIRSHGDLGYTLNDTENFVNMVESAKDQIKNQLK